MTTTCRIMTPTSLIMTSTSRIMTPTSRITTPTSRIMTPTWRIMTSLLALSGRLVLATIEDLSATTRYVDVLLFVCFAVEYTIHHELQHDTKIIIVGS